MRSEGLTPDERDQLFAAICDAVTALPFGADVDVTGMPFDEVADWAEDYGR